jgi:hypothetical protein
MVRYSKTMRKPAEANLVALVGCPWRVLAWGRGICQFAPLFMRVFSERLVGRHAAGALVGFVPPSMRLFCKSSKRAFGFFGFANPFGFAPVHGVGFRDSQ